MVPDHSKAVAALAQLEYKLYMSCKSKARSAATGVAQPKSLSEIEQLFLRALDCNPDDTQNLINFAQFMKNARHNLDGAKSLLFKVRSCCCCTKVLLYFPHQPGVPALTHTGHIIATVQRWHPRKFCSSAFKIGRHAAR